MQAKLIFLKRKPILVTEDKTPQKEFPYFTIETLVNGELYLMQVDNLHDVDWKNQQRIIAGVAGLPTVDFSEVTEEFGINPLAFITSDEVIVGNVEVKLINNRYIISKFL